VVPPTDNGVRGPGHPVENVFMIRDRFGDKTTAYGVSTNLTYLLVDFLTFRESYDPYHPVRNGRGQGKGACYGLD
jgi:hypothetical protein